MIQSYKDMRVYQKAYEYSLKIHRITLTFPKMEQYELGSQLRRATKSIAMNVAEGFAKRKSAAEFKRFLNIALGSKDEVLVQLEYCKDLGYIGDEQYTELSDAYSEIGGMLVKVIRTWQ